MQFTLCIQCVTNASVMAEQKADNLVPSDTENATDGEVKTNGAPLTPKKDKKDASQQDFKLGDLVWAKLSSFPAWPGRIVKPWKHVRKPAGKKATYFVYFFGTEDHAWVRADNLKNYLEHKEPMTKAAKGVKLQKAIEAIEAAIKEEKDKLTVSPYHPEDEDEITPKKPTKDYTREPLSGKSKLNSTQPESPTKKSRGKQQQGDKTGDVNAAEEEEEEEDSKPLKPSPKKRGRPRTNDLMKVSFASSKRKVHTSTGTPIKRPKADNVTFSSLNLYNSFQAHLAEKSGTVPKAAIKPTDKSIGFVGLGLMGTGMVMNLIKTGHNVTVWNRTPEKCEEIMKAGAEKADSVFDLVSKCDITFSMVSDSEALRAIVYGEKGASAGMTEGKAFVDMSTVDIGTITGVEAAISSRGGRFLEAPVSGSVSPAMEGSLIILAAGDKEVYDECQSCFQAMGKKAFFLGDIGNGARIKLVLNLIGGNIMCGLAEGMALAEKAGLSQSVLLEVLNLGSLASPLVCGKGNAIIAGKFPPAFPLKYQQKDFRLALAMADQVEQPLPVSAAAHEVYKRAKNHGFGDSDMSAVYRSINK
ncbi:cytokine-like nuclear factor N-PAC isoform X2 [Apostichopus japonicus]|uniref:cytokine-like nuclear factor N-PAC isoform X2 n=1 Tax=Stichopus japonicus TaxID=307972 RepID=UPI003AB618C9